MLYAVDEDMNRISAEPGTNGSCPICYGAVIPKCGTINVPHWAHKSTEDCDPWAEGESDWHRDWKGILPEGNREVVITRGGQSHRADLVAPGQLVIELQRSPLSPYQIASREAFYAKMLWLFDIRDCRHNGYAIFSGQRLEVHRFNLRQQPNYHSFRWKHPRKHVAYASKPVFLDIGDNLVFRVRRIGKEVPCGGWGRLMTRPRFIQQLRAGQIPS